MKRKHPNLRLKERVRAGELTAQQALDLLAATRDPWAHDSHTWGWLVRKGAREGARPLPEGEDA